MKFKINLKEKMDKALEEAAKVVAPKLKEAMLEDIKRGVSPVRGQRFAKYSDSYKKAIRKGYVKKGIAPVNLELTGALIKSLKTLSLGKIVRIIWADKKAFYHNEGTPNMPRRAILPLTGERFNEKIIQIITKAVKSALSKIR